MTALRLEAFKTSLVAPALVPCTRERRWMDAFPERHAYRCLPLSIANAHGWQVLVPAAFEIEWNGGPEIADLTVRALEPFPDGLPLRRFAESNFSRGIVTLNVGYLFRTPVGWNVLATGPLNEPRPGIQPLAGIIETDWMPFTFTMNWQMTEPGVARFARDDVFCTIMPIPKNYLEQWDVAIHELTDDPVLLSEYEQFRATRAEFREARERGDPAVANEGWQRHYFTGRFPDGTEAIDHSNRLRLQRPVDRIGTRPVLAKARSASATISAELETKAIRRWRRQSLLEHLNHEQDSGNLVGAARVALGVLTPSPATVTITPDLGLEPDALDFIHEPGFLTPAECALLVETANGGTAPRRYGDILLNRPGVAAMIGDSQRRVMERLRRFYRLIAPLFAESVGLERLRSGHSISPHAGRADPESRDFASIVFINDDYDGGELYFPRLDLVIRPTKGLLVAFTGGWHHEHCVLRVRTRDQFTMPAFYTFEASRRDRDMQGPVAG